MILGLDPGTVRTGFALVAVEEHKCSLVKLGVLYCNAKKPLPQRLLELGQAVKNIYSQHPVSDTALERVFFGKNPDSAFKLGQAFGLFVYQAMAAGSQVFPYAARYIKQSVTGSGNADKKAVQIYVLNFFKIKKDKISPDATDALAVALCHIHQKQNSNLQLLSSSVQIEEVNTFKGL